MILAGDIGGTKTYIALFDKNLRLKREKKYKSSSYPSLDKIIESFLKKERRKISIACFAVAGPIIKERSKVTNLPWTIDASLLVEKLSIPRVFLINDIEAMGYGLNRLSSNQFYTLNSGDPTLEGNGALIAAGTGLGEAILLPRGKGYVPFASEGGHSDFAPRNKDEVELFYYLRKKYDHVSYERVLSGEGLYNIYKFLVHSKKEKGSPLIERAFQKKQPSAVITEQAYLRKNRVCMKALDLFISIYGAEAGNVALKFLAQSGVYIGGGIVVKILDRIKKGSFMTAFLDKGRFFPLLKNIPVKVILNEKANLLGAAYFAKLKGKIPTKKLGLEIKSCSHCQTM